MEVRTESVDWESLLVFFIFSFTFKVSIFIYTFIFYIILGTLMLSRSYRRSAVIELTGSYG